MDIIITIIYPVYRGHYYYNYLILYIMDIIITIIYPEYNRHYYCNYVYYNKILLILQWCGVLRKCYLVT